MPPLITVTPAALAQIRAVIEQADDPDLGLRAAARLTEAGEIAYGMGLDEPREQDEQIAIDDTVTVLISPPSRELIAGTVIDYVEVSPGEPQFVFYRAEEIEQEPAADAAKGCSCGKGGCGS
jgi:iron-sulfur cluster assembly protein